MKTACANWKEYESIAGPVAFCEAAAYNSKVDDEVLKAAGCTAEKRKTCLKNMEALNGFGLVPEMVERLEEKETVKNIVDEKEVNVMSKCPKWFENEGLNGAVAFCSAGAYGRNLTAEEAKEFGCSELKRERCLRAMVNANGFGLVPEIVATVPARADMIEREELLGMLG